MTTLNKKKEIKAWAVVGKRSGTFPEFSLRDYLQAPIFQHKKIAEKYRFKWGDCWALKVVKVKITLT